MHVHVADLRGTMVIMNNAGHLGKGVQYGGSDQDENGCFAVRRLFEMGFQDQLHSILARLPESRQTLLFSATLPKLLVNFAKAGLHDPTLIRLDVDTKISDQLRVSLFLRSCVEALILYTYICCLISSKTSDYMCLD